MTIRMLLFALTFLLLTGCMEQQSKMSPAVVVAQPKPIEVVRYPDGVAFPSDFDDTKLNLYWGEKSVNFVAETVTDLHVAFGSPERSIKEFFTNSDEVFLDSYEGKTVKVSYAKKSGLLRQIFLTNKNLSLERGAKVGDAKESILENYPGGYEAVSDYKEYPGEMYCFMVVDSMNLTVARGYKFYFGMKKEVQAILIGYEAYAP